MSTHADALHFAATAALGMPELLTEVFSYLPPHQLALVATVCKRWSPLALDALWWEVYDLSALTQLLDPIMSAPDPGVALASVIGVTARNRFLLFGRRVRSLLSHPEETSLSSSTYDVLVAIRQTQTAPLLPNLLRVIFTPESFWGEDTIHRNLVILFPAVVEQFVLDVRDYLPGECLDAIGPWSPTLQYLELRAECAISDVAPMLLSTLRRLPRLKYLYLPAFWSTTAVLEEASHLQDLEVLESIVDNRCGVGDEEDVASVHPAFSSGTLTRLTNLSLCASLVDVLGILQHLCGSRRLTTLEVQSATAFESSDAVNIFLAALPNLVPDMDFFTLELRLPRKPPRSLKSLGAAHLYPLRSLQRLRSLYIYHQRPLDLSDGELDEFLRGMPGLTHLYLGNEPFVGARAETSLLTCAALDIALRRCPRLKQLGLFLNTQAATPATPQYGAGTRFNDLFDLDVGCSILNEKQVMSVRERLLRILPSGCRLHWGHEWEQVPVTSFLIDMERKAYVWNKVDSHLRQS